MSASAVIEFRSHKAPYSMHTCPARVQVDGGSVYCSTGLGQLFIVCVPLPKWSTEIDIK
jgi:hypothetical protein